MQIKYMAVGRVWRNGLPEQYGKDSEAAKVFDTTNEIIRKITRYAARISEMSNAGANRREEYHKVAVMFSKCKNILRRTDWPLLYLALKSRCI